MSWLVVSMSSTVAWQAESCRWLKPVVSGDPSSGVFSFGYDTAGRLTSETNPQSQVMSYQLDANGANTSYSYDLGNNLLTMNIAFVGSAANWTYTFNKVRQISARTAQTQATSGGRRPAR